MSVHTKSTRVRGLAACNPLPKIAASSGECTSAGGDIGLSQKRSSESRTLQARKLRYHNRGGGMSSEKRNHRSEPKDAFRSESHH